MSRPDVDHTGEHRGPTEYPPQLSPVQAWLLGHIDAATLHDRVAAMGEGGPEMAAAYGRAIADEAYAAALIEQAQDALEAGRDVMTSEEQAYAMYEALTDPLDEAIRERDASVTGAAQPSDDELRAEFEEVHQELGLPPGTGDHGPEFEAER